MLLLLPPDNRSAVTSRNCHWLCRAGEEREREREHCQWREEERDEEEKKSGIGSLRERGEWHIASRCVIVILGCELCLSLVLIEEC